MTQQKKPLQVESFECVWDAICDSPQEANEMRVRSDLMLAIESVIRSDGPTPAVVARRHGLQTKAIRQILSHRFNEFSLKDLLDIAASPGFRPVVTLQKRKAA